MMFDNFSPKCEYCGCDVEFLHKHVPWGSVYICNQHKNEVWYYYEQANGNTKKIVLYKKVIRYKLYTSINVFPIYGFMDIIDGCKSTRVKFIDSNITPENAAQKVKTYLTFQ